MLPFTDPDLGETAEATASLAVTLAWAVGAIVVAYVLATFASVLIRRLGRRNPLVRDMGLRMRRPMRAVLMIVAFWLAVHLTADRNEPWFDAVGHVLLIATIIAVAWLVGAVAFVVEDRTLARFSGDRVDDRHARRVRTQVNLVRRVTVAALVICAIAAVLLTFPTMQAAGASILASAGVLSIVLGVAAQSSLANAFAGMQIAFTDAIRVDDVVVLNGEFGRIEEITLTYVVVHAWDDRRLILPCTYFTTTPFENWTRRAADLLGTVVLDLDFQVPMGELRAELDRLLDSSALWDRRTGVLQVTDAVDGRVRVRALVSAADAPTLWDLRCFVREGLVEWLQREVPEALPRMRVDGVTARAGAPGRAADGGPAGVEAVVDGEPGDEPDAEHARDAKARGRGRKGKAGAAPAVVPARAPVRHRDLPSPTRSTVRPATPGKGHGQDRTVVLGAVELPGEGGDRPLDATVVMPAIEDLDAEQGSTAERSALYSGSAEAEARSKHFHGPGQDVIEQREQTALLHLGEAEVDEENAADTADVEPADDDDPADGRSGRRGRLAPDSGDGGPTGGRGDGGGDGN
ncbi:mechanosensitive ion channel family protein [Isoptericola sp. NEAU-Y5]|uniref:Mechanosensitive ion channel family protein n=1 Tax=Isoptericola luteus TaxID=2879484 RepID=A0ABS7ZAN3_9MICO|nr:mechanosensitive ion channel family protein [Isoptericola sp. NEAU-Y5]MCA5892109.1 mechanosensitive ion channel family protein [Isoptericola sp. NEAU-Y5]